MIIAAHPHGHSQGRTGFSDPLALSSGIGARLALAAAVLAGLWAAVAWAMAL